MDDIYEVVIKDRPAPTTSQEKFQRYADRFVAMIITQTYSYMIGAGIRHGCIITGEAMIFLFVKHVDPHTVHFYHADPTAEIDLEEEANGQCSHECTAVGQLLTFSLISQDYELYPQEWRRQVREVNMKWSFRDEEEDEIPKEAHKEERPPSASKRRREIINSYRSPIPLRSRFTSADPPNY